MSLKLAGYGLMVDYADLKQQLEQAGIQHPEELLDFQRKFGGRIYRNGLELVRFGLVHERPAWFKPGKICVETDLFEDEEGAPSILINCADINPQDAFYIDENCVIYDLSGPINESPEMFFLQDNYLNSQNLKWDLHKAQEIQKKTIQDMAGVLPLTHISDRYSQFYEDDEYVYYFRNGYYFKNGEGFDAWRKVSVEQENTEPPVSEQSSVTQCFRSLWQRIWP